MGYLSEIKRIGVQTGPRLLNTVFFGGGTPSLMDPDIVYSLIQYIKETWPCADDLEITLEANPGSVEAGRFQGYAHAGVNRISMGIQALNDRDLKRLGRIHSVADAERAFNIARTIFDRISFDLIYARQDQSRADWRTELTRALEMAVDHFSLYQLTIEQGTAFGALHAQGRLRGLPADSLSADMYKMTADLCGNAGFEAYEISNHARPGAASRHNLIYWRYGDYAGIGPGAHGRLSLSNTRYAIEAKRLPEVWLASTQTASAELQRIEITRKDQADEFLMMGLRLQEGIDFKRYRALSGTTLDPQKIEYLSEIGMIESSENRIRASQRGRLVLNAIIKELLL